MKIALPAAALALALFSPLLLGASKLDQLPDPDKLFKDRKQVHALVAALEAQPAHANAEKIRALLVVHYKEVDYLVCGNVYGPMAERKEMAPVMWQMIIASGDWVEANPAKAKDIDAYTLAGLESGVRTYRNLQKAQPTLKDATLDLLAKEYEAGTLPAWNKAHPCRPDE